jgi:hypothetical protein
MRARLVVQLLKWLQLRLQRLTLKDQPALRRRAGFAFARGETAARPQRSGAVRDERKILIFLDYAVVT